MLCADFCAENNRIIQNNYKYTNIIITNVIRDCKDDDMHKSTLRTALLHYHPYISSIYQVTTTC